MNFINFLKLFIFYHILAKKARARQKKTSLLKNNQLFSRLFFVFIL